MKTPRSFTRTCLLSHLRIPAAVTLISAGAAMALLAASPGSRQIAISGTSSPQTGHFKPSGDSNVIQVEFPGQGDAADGSPGPYPGFIVNRSLSTGAGKGVSVN